CTILLAPASTLFPYTTLFRSRQQLRKALHEGFLLPFAVPDEVTNTQGWEVLSGIPTGQAAYLAVAFVSEYAFANPGGVSNAQNGDRKSTRLNSSHVKISYAVF